LRIFDLRKFMPILRIYSYKFFRWCAMRFTLFTLTAVLLSCSFSVQAKTYRWQDESGQIHFGDKIPIEYVIRAHDELNSSGMVVRHRAAAKTAEQKKEERRIEYELKKAALIVKKKKQRDRVLLDTYTTERDLLVARDSRLDAVASQIQLSNSIIVDSNKKIESMEQQVVDIQASNREVPPDLHQRISNEKEQVMMQYKLKKVHEQRWAAIGEQFNGYIKRFQVLKAGQQEKRERLAREDEL
jgi:hypothetical protein